MHPFGRTSGPRARSIPLLVVAGALLTGVGCADRSTAPEGFATATLRSAFAAQGAVPFKGKATGQDVSVTLGATGIRIVANAAGTATETGRFTEVLDYVLSYDLINFAGGATITAADGANVVISFTGAIPGFANQVFPLPYTADYTITGGTGRFTGSAGSGTLNGIDHGGGAFAFEFTGSFTGAH